MSHIKAPWTPAEQDAINAYQNGEFHPFTCDQGHHLPLVAGTYELTCPAPGCLYKQTWVHAFMAGHPVNSKDGANHG